MKSSVLKRNPDASKTIVAAIQAAKNSVQAAQEEQKAAVNQSAGIGANGVYLFTTKTCPNCKIAKQFLKDENYQVVDAEEHPELTDAYGIMQAPTLVIVNNGEVHKFVNASNIKKYVDSKK